MRVGKHRFAVHADAQRFLAFVTVRHRADCRHSVRSLVAAWIIAPVLSNYAATHSGVGIQRKQTSSGGTSLAKGYPVSAGQQWAAAVMRLPADGAARKVHSYFA